MRRAFTLLVGSALLLGQAVGARPDVAVARGRQGGADTSAARKAFDEARRWKEQGGAEALRRALQKFEEARGLYRAAGARREEAATLIYMGGVHFALGDYAGSLRDFEQALPLCREAGDRRAEAVALNNMGEVYSRLGERHKALDYLTRSLPLRREAGDRAGEAATLNNIASIYYYVGEYRKALETYSLSMPILRELKDRAWEAATLSNVGMVCSSLGEYQWALDFFNHALRRAREAQDRAGEAVTLGNIGGVYLDLGEPERALEYLRQVLPMWRALGDRAEEAKVLGNFGVVYSALGDSQRALAHLEEALALERALGDRANEGSLLNSIGDVHVDREDFRKGLEYYQRALALRRAAADREGEALTLKNIGFALGSLKEYAGALEHLNQSLAAARAIGDRVKEAGALEVLADVNLARGRPAEARGQIEAAITIIESVRTKVSAQSLRASYFASVNKYYEIHREALMRLHREQPTAGFDVLAFQVSERARARSLLELLAESRTDIRAGGDPKLLERERSLLRQLSAKADYGYRLRAGRHTAEQEAALRAEIDALNREYQQVQAEIRAGSSRYAALTQPRPLTLDEIRREVLDADTLLLEYALGHRRSYLWAVTSDTFAVYELPGRDEIEGAARRAYAAIAGDAPAQGAGPDGRDRGSRLLMSTPAYVGAAAELSRMLLAPAASHLGRKRLLIVGDGALQYLPFGALPAPAATAPGGRATNGGKEPSAPAGPPLVVTHEVVSLPSASTLAVLRRETSGRAPAPKSLAVLADPVFDPSDERVRGGAAAGATPAAGSELRAARLARAARAAGVRGGTLPRLRHTRREAEAIAALFPEAERKQALDFDASRAAATAGDLGQYRYVHFATHGLVDTEQPDLSGIVLSMVDGRGAPQDGFLRALDVYNLHLPAELVVLSACQTGLGKNVRGEGLVGLTRGFMYAGARRVVVSLWNVNDEATADLMARFYREMLAEKKPPAAALRAAQLALMRDKRWESPYYWAAFVLQGEWN